MDKKHKRSFKDAIKEMKGFCGMRGKGFGFETMAQAKKALGVAENAANFLNWKVEKGEDCFVLREKGKDKKTVNAGLLLRKYAEELGLEPEFMGFEPEEAFPHRTVEELSYEDDERDRLFEDIMQEAPEGPRERELFERGVLAALRFM